MRRILLVLLIVPAVLGLTALPAHALTFTVTLTTDENDGECILDCTLREAITAANALLGLDNIDFNIPGAGQHTIAPTSALPAITSPVDIDGFSDPDDAGRIELDGTNAGAGVAGLSVSGAGTGTTIEGMVINDFGDEAIELLVGGNTVQGTYLGTDVTGLVADGNFVGISIGGSGNQIGGTGVGEGNLISGNTNNGVSLTATNTVLQGNLIGPGSDGSTDLGNGNQGVHLFSVSTNNTIGGTTAAARNVISGNSAAGIMMGAATNTGNVVQGNYIGTKSNGTEALPNNGGVRLGFGANANTIGGTAAGAGNLISGNIFHGVQVFDSASSGNTIQGNLIGTTWSGTTALGNGSDGINVFDAPSTVIGGGAAGAANVVSGNSGDGIDISENGADASQVKGNIIGLGSNGTTDLGNGGNGILLSSSDFTGLLTGTALGGTGAGEENLVSGNGGDGIGIGGFRVQGTTIQGNIVGLASDGVTDRGNDGDGIESAAAPGTTTVGGTTAAARNVISGNGGMGVLLSNLIGNYVVQGNYIGTDATGTVAVGNGDIGALVQGDASTIGGTTGVTVGGSCTGACNLISGNASSGIHTSSDNLIQGNYIGTDVTGLLDRGNSGAGISSGTDSSVITIGGTAPEARNVISGNNNAGISWGDAGANNDIIQGNYIGVGSDGTTAVGNSNTGIALSGDNNTIGGTAAGAGNVIAFNGGGANPGVMVGADAADNEIRGNSIHSNGGLGIDLDPFGVTANDLDDPDGGANLGQNFPLLSTAEVTAGAVTVTGTLNSAPSSTFALDFYANTACNAASPNNHGEGRTYLGELTPVTTNAGGDAAFTFTSDGSPAVSAGDVITATATDANGNTSEFSRCRVALGTTSPTISIADATVTEGDAGTTNASFTVTLSAASPDTVTADWATAEGMATDPEDYQSSSGTVTFVPSDTMETIQVPVNGDVIDEGTSETFSVNLSNAGGATISDGQATGTITDDDEATISIDDETVTEGNTGSTPATFTVSLSTTSSSQVTVDWATTGDTATSPADFTAGSGTVTFAPGDDEETVVVNVNGDTLDESDETFNVNLSNASGATIADSQGVGTITDDDTATISVADATVTEGNSGTATASFTVTLSTQSASQVTVDWATSDGTATSPSDYAADSGTVTFAPLDTSETIAVTVNGDTAVEPNETFSVALSNPTGATISNGTATGTLTNDDATPPPPPPPPPTAPKCPGFEGDARPQLVGTEGADVLTGTPAAEIVCGLGGNDVLKGGGGNDLVLGGGGNDRMAGQAGKDLLKGQAGNDRMNGGPGIDRCQGGPAKDSARACEKGRA